MKPDFELDIGRKSFASGLLPELISALRKSRPGDLVAVTGDEQCLGPELDIASQGLTVEEATANLKEAVELFLDTADGSEIEQRLRQPVFITHFEITRG